MAWNRIDSCSWNLLGKQKREKKWSRVLPTAVSTGDSMFDTILVTLRLLFRGSALVFDYTESSDFVNKNRYIRKSFFK